VGSRAIEAPAGQGNRQKLCSLGITLDNVFDDLNEHQIRLKVTIFRSEYFSELVATEAQNLFSPETECFLTFVKRFLRLFE